MPPFRPGRAAFDFCRRVGCLILNYSCFAVGRIGASHVRAAHPLYDIHGASVAYDRAHYYLTFGGQLYGAQEVWQTGLRFVKDPASPDPSDLLEALTAISVSDILQDAVTLMTDGLTVLWGSFMTVYWAKLAVILPDGKYAGDAKLATIPPEAGGAGAFADPPQLAACVSLWSGTNLGKANHGRSYLPVPHTWITSLSITEPRVSVAQATGLRDAYKTFVNAAQGEISTVVGGTFYPAIMNNQGAGVTKPVLHIGAGRVIDTIRARRNHLDEATAYAPL
jgi:hypothetical protein